MLIGLIIRHNAEHIVFVTVLQAKNVSHILPDYDNEVQMGDYIYGNKVQ